MLEQVGQQISESWSEVWAVMAEWFLAHALNIVVILVLGWVARILLTKLVRNIVKQTVRHDLFPSETDRKKRLQTLDGLVGTIVKIVVWVVVVVMLINELGINTGPLIASAGIIGIVVGFGAQTLIKDFTSGLFIIAENQYRVGDTIEINDITGVVEQITIRTTVLRDINGYLHHIPNGSIEVTTNMTMDYAKLHENITVDTDTDIEQLEHVINHVGEQLAAKPELHKLIVEAPKFVRVTGFNNEGLAIKIIGKTTPGDQWKVQGEFYKQLKKAFEKHHIKVPRQPLPPVITNR
jgi:small conductance mechanosensitive channel